MSESKVELHQRFDEIIFMIKAHDQKLHDAIEKYQKETERNI